ncbi:MAG: glycine--tRNA ligase subunit beta [Fimbriimonadia bacterium]|nr:glycine--tRNA ligase subunit beta [Fimbriimonadia bacterium]
MSQVSAELLIEIGCEEIPAAFMRDSLEQLKTNLSDRLTEARLSFGKVSVCGTPRRLIAVVESVALQQTSEERVARGPAKRACFDEQGNPTQALSGFLRSQNATLESVEFVAQGQNEYATVRVLDQGRPSVEVLSELIPETILSMTFPKMLRWGDSQIRFARPLRWLLCLLGGEVVPCEIEGIRSGNKTRGHRFHAPSEFEVRDSNEFFAKLCEAFVLSDPEERKQKIREESEQLAKTLNATALLDEELLEENVFLSEYPKVILGEFPKEFLILPVPVLVTAMKKHQKYFPLKDQNGNLMPNFLSVSNAGQESSVREGNEWVLVARFNDAKFFFDEDLKHPFESLVPKLDRILFQQKLGTLLAKTERLGKLAVQLATALDWNQTEIATIRRAAQLCKADLASQMVKELPELQGTIGQEYALKAGESEGVATAIREHYMPRHAGDDLPVSEAGRALALLDRMDTLVGYVGLGYLPKGSSDPYGLRRSANGVIEILAQEQYYPTLSELVQAAHDAYRESGVALKPLMQAQSDLRGLFMTRLESYLEEQGIRYDMIRATLGAGWDDSAHAILKRAQTLQAHASDESWTELVTTATRPANILSSAEKKNIRAVSSLGAINPDLMEADAERDLYRLLHELTPKVEAEYNLHRFDALYETLRALQPAVNRLFDDVMVMADDEAIRKNRLNLLACANRLFMALADFTQVVQA